MTDSKTDIVYVDVIPACVQAREYHTYDINIRATSGIKPATGQGEVERMRGEVRIEAPYDGFRSFPIELEERLKKMKTISEKLNGRAGWLAISRPLDFDRGWEPELGAEILPVEIPLVEHGVISPMDWTADQLRVVLQHEYSLVSPRFFPIQIEMQVVDSAEDVRAPARDGKDRYLRDKDLQSILDLDLPSILNFLNGRPLQGGRLIVDLTVTVNVPVPVIGEKKNIDVFLDELIIEWPTIATGWQLLIAELRDGEYEEIPWRYDPDRTAIEIQGLKATAEEPDLGSLLRPYRCRLRLSMLILEEMIKSDQINGQARARISGCLLSGRQVAWMDVGGQRMPRPGDADRRKREMALTHETVLCARFDALLSEQFRQRRSAVYRQWRFPGVSFSESRLDDIAGVLRDMGYVILEQPPVKWRSDKANQDAYAIGVVSAERVLVQPNAQPAILNFQVWAIPIAPAATRHDRSIPDVGSVTTELSTCDLMIQIRGSINGPGSLLALDADQLMTHLKNRLLAIADFR